MDVLSFGEERYLFRFEKGLYLVAGVIAFVNVDIMDEDTGIRVW